MKFFSTGTFAAAVISTTTEYGDVVTNAVAVGDTLRDVVVALSADPTNEVVFEAATVMGFTAHDLRVPRGNSSIFDGVQTYGRDSGVVCQNHVLRKMDEVKEIVVEVSGNMDAPVFRFLKVAMIKSIGSVIAGSDEPAVAVESAQEALDKATDGAVIKLAAGNHGILYIRQSDLSEEVWVGHGGGALDKYTNGRKRVINGLHIIGEPGAVVEHIFVECGKFSKEGDHSNSATKMVLESFIELNDVVIDSVTFKMSQDTSAFHVFSNGEATVNGLTFKNCEFYGDGNEASKNQRITYVSSPAKDHNDLNGNLIIDGTWKNVTVENCTATDMYQVIELRHCENVTIKGNSFINTRARDILLAGKADESKFTGKIEIVGNISDGSTERFIRANYIAGEMEVSDNKIVNWAGADEDFIKITNIMEGGVVTGSNNTYDGAVVEMVDGVCLKPVV